MFRNEIIFNFWNIYGIIYYLSSLIFSFCFPCYPFVDSLFPSAVFLLFGLFHSWFLFLLLLNFCFVLFLNFCLILFLDSFLVLYLAIYSSCCALLFITLELTNENELLKEELALSYSSYLFPRKWGCLFLFLLFSLDLSVIVSAIFLLGNFDALCWLFG